MRKSLSILFLVAAISTVSAALPFVDNFGNGQPQNSDDRAGFWTLIPPPPFTTSQITEDVGVPGVTPTNLHLIAAGQADLVGTNTSPDFNFFTQPLTINLTGLTFALQGTGGTTTAQEQFRFALMSSGGQTPAAANSAVALLIDAAGNVKFGYKLTGSGNAEDFNTLLSTNVSANGAVTGFSLSLTNTAYTLAITETGGTSNFSGAISGLNAASWIPGGNGDSALAVEALRNNNTSDIFTVNIDKLEVIPEPCASTFVLSTLVSAAMVAAYRRVKRLR
jgi:hypothetical protein